MAAKGAPSGDTKVLSSSSGIKGGSAPAPSKMRSDTSYPNSKGHSNYGRLFQREKSTYGVGGK